MHENRTCLLQDPQITKNNNELRCLQRDVVLLFDCMTQLNYSLYISITAFEKQLGGDVTFK